MGYKIAVVPGDGIGQEITSEAVRVLKAVDATFSLGLSYETRDAGGTAYDKYGTPLPEDTLAVCKASDGVLFGAVGGTKWDAVEPALRPERAILGLRKGLGHYADVELDHLYVDNCAMQLAVRPTQFDVVVTGNLFGDILSDEAAVIGGSIGLMPSASIGTGTSLFEPIHGSAPDIAGQGIANPLGTILSAAMLLRYALHEEEAAAAIEAAVDAALADGMRTADIYLADTGCTKVGTQDMTDAVLKRL